MVCIYRNLERGRKITDEKKSCWLAQGRGLLRGNPRDSEKIEGTRDKRDIDQQTGTDLKR